MLSRLAVHCFWLSRYLERAENTARLLGAANAQALAPEASSNSQRPWRVVVAVATDPHRFGSEFGPATAESIAAHLLVDRDNPSSVVSCLRAVRENARSVRHLLNVESWEAVNSTWLEAREFAGAVLEQRGLDHWLGWTRQRCQWIKGALDDQLRDELYAVLMLGQALERADFISRMLVAALPALLSEPNPEPGTFAHRDWEALLAAAGMVDAYYRTTSQPLRPDLAMDLLIRGTTSTRSLLSNVERLASSLAALVASVGNDTASAIAALAEELKTCTTSDLPSAAGRALTRINAIGAALQREHFMPSDR
jgi:uncharacterized alpha-E superfamily protein